MFFLLSEPFGCFFSFLFLFICSKNLPLRVKYKIVAKKERIVKNTQMFLSHFFYFHLEFFFHLQSNIMYHTESFSLKMKRKFSVINKPSEQLIII